MAIKYDRASVSPGVNVASRINQELQKIQEALERALDRLGESPNAMESDLDMGLNSIINLKSLDVQELLIDGEKIVPGSAFSGDVLQGIYDAIEALQEELDNLEIDVEIDLTEIESRMDSILSVLQSLQVDTAQILSAIEGKDYSAELGTIIDLLEDIAQQGQAPGEGKQYYINATLLGTAEGQDGDFEVTYVHYLAEESGTGTILGTNLPGEVVMIQSAVEFNPVTQEVRTGYVFIGFFLPAGMVLDTPTVTIPSLGIENTDNVVTDYGEVDGLYACEMIIQNPGGISFPVDEPVRIEINTRS